MLMMSAGVSRACTSVYAFKFCTSTFQQHFVTVSLGTLLAEAVEKLRSEAIFDVCLLWKRTLCSRFRPMPGRVLRLRPDWVSLLHMIQAMIGLGGGL